MAGFSKFYNEGVTATSMSLEDSTLSLLHSSGLNANVAIKLPSGELVCGSVRWINSEYIELACDTCLSPATSVELRVELKGWSETIYIQAAVARIRPTGETGSSRAIVRIIDLSDNDRNLLFVWLRDHEAGGTSVDPCSIVAKSGHGRSSVKRGILSALK